MSLRRIILIFSISILPLTLMVIHKFYELKTGVFDRTGHVVGRDFVNLWVGGQLFAEGKVAAPFNFPSYKAEFTARLTGAAPAWAFPDGVAHIDYLWAYPPTAGLFAEPFGALPYVPAYVAFMVLTFGLFAVAVLSAARPEDRGFVGAALVVAPATLVTVLAGQNGFLTAALLIAAIVVGERKPIVGGLLLGLLSFKPQLALFAAFVLAVRGQWSMLGGACLSALALNGAAALRYGFEPFWLYVTYTLPLVRDFAAGFTGFQQMMMVSVFADARTFGLEQNAAGAVQAVVSIAVLGAGAMVARRIPALPDRLLFIALGTLLVTPYAFNYDLPMLAGAVILYAAVKPTGSTSAAMLLGLTMIVPVAVYPLHASGWGCASLPVALAFAWMCWQNLPVGATWTDLAAFRTMTRLTKAGGQRRYFAFAAENTKYSAGSEP